MSAGRNLINNFVQNKVPVSNIQSYQNTQQIVTVAILTELNVAPKIILLIIMFF